MVMGVVECDGGREMLLVGASEVLLNKLAYNIIVPRGNNFKLILCDRPVPALA
jgi:hypothetical protein